MQNAFKSYVRTRDYCTTGKHVIQMCLNVIKVSIELGNYVHVNNYISKAEQTAEVQVSCLYTHKGVIEKSPALLVNIHSSNQDEVLYIIATLTH